MLKRRQAGANFIDTRRVEIADDDTFFLVESRQHLAPGVDQQTVTRGFSVISMPTALGAGQNVALVLDGPRAQQDFPVCPPGLLGEGGR